MLKLMSGVTGEERIGNKYIRGCTRVSSIEDKIRENRLRWFGLVIR